MIYDLDKTVEGLDLKGVEYVKPEYGYYAETRRYLTFEGLSLTLLLDRYNGRLSASWADATLRLENVDKTIALLGSVKKIDKAYEKVMEASRKKEAEERAEREKQYKMEREKEAEERAKEQAEANRLAEIRAVKTKEREERMLNEFLGDEVRVKVPGFKSKVRAHVRSIERRGIDGETYWQPRLEYVQDQIWHWPKDIGQVVLLEAKVGGRWQVIWNDIKGGGVTVGRRSVPKRRR